MVTPYFLYPHLLLSESPGELEVATEVFGEASIGAAVNAIPSGSVVIPRFRAIPFGKELEEEVALQGSRLINSYREHCAIADLFSWVHLLEGLTPPSYRMEDYYPSLPEGAYFLKGETNSLKNQWFKSAFAPTKSAILEVASNLSTDLVTGAQEVVIRPFQDYRKLGNAVDGRPIFHERRVFTYRGEVLSEGFYWSSYAAEWGNVEARSEEAYRSVLEEAISRVKHLCPFLVIDLAEYENGDWGVVELNSGPMSGLSENSPVTVWGSLREALLRE